MRKVYALIIVFAAVLILRFFIPVWTGFATYGVGPGQDNETISECLISINNTGDTCVLNVSNQTYTINGTYTYNLTGRAVDIQASNVTLDCNNSALIYPLGTGTNEAVYSYSSQSNITIKNCRIENYKYGVYTYNTEKVYLTNNTMFNTTSGGNSIYIYNCDNSEVNNNTVNIGKGEGIYLAYSDNSTITNNTVTNLTGSQAVDIYQSDNVVMSYNSILNSTNGISIKTSIDNITIKNNTIADNVGLIISELDELKNSTISGNTMSNNIILNMYLKNGENNVIANNTMLANIIWTEELLELEETALWNPTLDINISAGNISGITADLSALKLGAFVFENENNDTVSNNIMSVNNFRFHHNSTAQTVNFTDDETTGVYVGAITIISSDNMTVSGNTMGISRSGFLFGSSGSNFTRFENVNVSINLYSLGLFSSDDNRVFNNDIAIENRTGILMDTYSNYTTLDSVKVSDLSIAGIVLSDSKNNWIENATIRSLDNGVFIKTRGNETIFRSGEFSQVKQGSVIIQSSHNNTVKNVTAEHRNTRLTINTTSTPIQNVTFRGYTLSDNLNSPIFLFYSDNNTITDSSFTASGNGVYMYSNTPNTEISYIGSVGNIYTNIYLRNSSNNNISNNVFYDSSFGKFSFDMPDNNLVANNSIEMVFSSAALESSSNNNTFSHNRILNNTVNTSFIDIFDVSKNNTVDIKVFSGMYLVESINNSFYANTILNSGTYDLYLDAENNTFWLNNFYSTGVNITGTNSFCENNQGNFYSSSVGSKYAGNDCGLVSLTNPTGGEVFTSSPATISWTEQSSFEPVTYKLQYSKDSGATWNSIGSTTSTSYSWDISGVPDLSTYRVRVTPSKSGYDGIPATTSSDFSIALRAPGGGGGGGGVVTPPSETKSWYGVMPNVTKTMEITETEIGFTDIEFQVKDSVSSASITVTKLTDKPTTVTPDPTGKVYQYMEIDRSDSINDANIQSATIKFSVSKTWISDNNIDRNRVVLNRYYNNVWQELETTPTREDQDYFYYESQTPGFSVFAITGQEIVKICDPGAKRCVGDELQQCDPRGAAWKTLETCEAGCNKITLACEPICTPGEKRCVDDELEKCASDGMTWETTQTCEYGCNEIMPACNFPPVEMPPEYGWVLIAIVVIIVIAALALLIFNTLVRHQHVWLPKI